MALSLVQNHFESRSDAAYFYAIREVVPMRKLKKYKPTRFMAKTSHYDKGRLCGDVHRVSLSYKGYLGGKAL